MVSTFTTPRPPIASRLVNPIASPLMSPNTAWAINVGRKLGTIAMAHAWNTVAG